jgi:serine/threonine-protein kinase
MFRDVIARLTRALSAEHMNTGIAHLKLGRALTGLARFEEAERHLTSGYAILLKQTSPSVPWLQTARTDLIKVYEALGQPEKAERYRSELAHAEAGASGRPGS